MGEYSVHRPMQIAGTERQVFADALFEGKPIVFDRVEVWGVGRQEFLPTPGLFNKAARFGGLMDTSVVIDHNLSRFEDGHQTVLHVSFKERGVTSSLEHQGGDEVVLREGIDQAHALGAMAGLVPPTRLALRTPAVRPRFVVIHACLLQIDPLLGGYLRQFRPKLFPQLFVPFGVAKGLFLCV